MKKSFNIFSVQYKRTAEKEKKPTGPRPNT